MKISDDKSDYDFELIETSRFNWSKLYQTKYQKIITWEDFQKLQKNFYTEPFAMIKKSDISMHDDSGGIIDTDLKKMREQAQKRIRDKNNPLELKYKIDYK